MFHPPIRVPSLGTQFAILLAVLLILLLLIVLVVFPSPLNG